MRIYKSLAGAGVTSRKDLRQAGMTRRQIDAAIQAGDLVKIDRCRLAKRNADPEAIKAARAGASLTCVSALQKLGVAVPPGKALHMRQRRYCRRTRGLPSGTLLCSIPNHSAGRPIDPLETALECLIRNHDDEAVVMALDSILHQRLRTRAELASVVQSISSRAQRLLSEADSRCESPLESVLRLRLKRRGVHPRSQVKIPGIGRVDFLIGRRLIIEADGAAFHNDPDHFENDRKRDQMALSLGYVVIRVTWRQLQDDWASVLGLIRDLVRCRTHLRAPERLPRGRSLQKSAAQMNPRAKDSPSSVRQWLRQAREYLWSRAGP